MSSARAGTSRRRTAPRPERTVPHPEFWRRFVSRTSTTDAGARYFGVLRIGDSKASGDEGAELVLSGVKRANSTLKMDYDAEGAPLPEVGCLSIVEDGSGRPVAVIETTEVVVEKFSEIDDAFARAYGEWGGSLKSWRRQCRAHYSPGCRAAGRPFTEDTELVCERFQVVFTAAEASGSSKQGR